MLHVKDYPGNELFNLTLTNIWYLDHIVCTEMSPIKNLGDWCDAFAVFMGIFAKKRREKLLNYNQSGSCVPPLTSKLCAEVWRTGYECLLNPGNENSKLEVENLKFPVKIDFWKSSSLQTETSYSSLE